MLGVLGMTVLRHVVVAVGCESEKSQFNMKVVDVLVLAMLPR